MGFPARLVKGIDLFTDICGRFIAWLTLLMALLVAVVVVMRYFFDTGSIAMQESAGYLHAAVFMLAASYALHRGGHVRVDIFYRNWSPRRQAVVDLFGTVFFLLPVCALIFWSSMDYVQASWAYGESSSEGDGLAFVYLLKSLLLVMPVTLGLQGLAEIIRNLLFLTGQSTAHSADHGESLL